MNQGRIVQVGTPSDIYESPANRFVADFIGSVNMFEGQVSRGEQRRRCASSARSWAARCASIARLPVRDGATVWAAIRPEKITISRQQPAAAPANENLVRGTVREIAYMGDVSIYLVQLESGQDGARDAAEHHRAAVSAPWRARRACGSPGTAPAPSC